VFECLPWSGLAFRHCSIYAIASHPLVCSPAVTDVCTTILSIYSCDPIDPTNDDSFLGKEPWG
jgi:hypothetical protein